MNKLILSCLLLLVSFGGWAQLSLAPTAIFLDKNGMGTMYVTNNSDVPQEVNVSFQFGYSFQDEKGSLIIVFNDSAKAKTHGLDQYIKAFPRTFNLPPKQQQLVRFQVRAPKDLAAGTYFTRVRVGSSTQAADIEQTTVDGISTKVNFRFEQVIAAFYKKGEVSTGMLINDVDVQTDSSFLSFMLNYKVLGNSPYLGRVKLEVKNPKGKIVAQGSQTIAMYFEGNRRMNLRSEEALLPGRYEIEITYETTRTDISQVDLVQAKPYTFKTYFQID